MRVARVQAQAKVNLFLRVYADRDGDGYHALFTAFQRIDLADDVVVRSGGGSRSLDVSGPTVPEGGLGPVEKNLAYRAALAFTQHPRVTMPRGFSIELTKRIPVGGGLGGGSADAGAVLRALNAIAPRPLSGAELHEIAASLGSDVPFLTSEHAFAYATGRGEKLTPAEAPPDRPVIIIVPSFGVATKDAYSWLDHDRPTDDRERLPEIGAAGAFQGWRAFATVGNDFEAVVEKRHPILREYREMLDEAGAVLSRLAGSGSSVFGVLDVVSWGSIHPEQVALKTSPKDAAVIFTRTSARVVEVEVLQ